MTIAAQDPKEEARERQFHAEWARYKAQQPALFNDEAETILAERVARSFWNSALEWNFRRHAAMHRAGLL
jgi:hypothetical protein